MKIVIGLVVVVALIVIYVIMTYNGLIRKKNYVANSWANIDVQLEKKHNILGNFVDAMEMGLEYERELLSEIINIRNGLQSTNKEEAILANEKLNNISPRIIALSENYPQLKGTGLIEKTMDGLKDCEDKIAYARTGYNRMTTNYNTALNTFPTIIFARMLNFQPEKPYELTDIEREHFSRVRLSDMRNSR